MRHRVPSHFNWSLPTCMLTKNGWPQGGEYGKCAGGGSVTAGGKCGRESFHLVIYPWTQYSCFAFRFISLFLSLFSFYSLLDGHSPSFQLALNCIHVFHNTSRTDLIQFILSTERKINTTNPTISLVPFVRHEFRIKCAYCSLFNIMTYIQTG